MEDAKKRLASWSLFGSSTAKKEDAAEMYKRAGSNYKSAGNWARAGEVFEESAKLQKALGESSAASAYWEAAKAYKKVEVGGSENAVRCYDEAIALFTDNDRHSSAARMCRDLGELSKAKGDFDKAAEAYKKAAHFFKAADQPSNANANLIEYAENLVMGKKPDYRKAVSTFENVAKESLDKTGLKYSVKKYLFQASICALLADVKSSDEDMKQFEARLDKYAEMDINFKDAIECKFLRQLAAAIDSGERKEFEAVVKKTMRRKRFDDWTVDILLTIKADTVGEDESSSGPAVAAAAGPDDEMPDLT